MEKAALYICASTDEQIEYNPSVQKSAMLKYAQQNHLTVLDEHIFMDEGISGREAPIGTSFMEMIRIAKQKPRPFDAILVHTLDGFPRSREDSVVYKTLLKKECGIKVISILEPMETDELSSKFEGMLATMAEYNTLNTPDETDSIMAVKAKPSQHSGSCPLGYQHVEDTQILQIDAKYSSLIPQIFDMYVTQEMSLLEIAKTLNTQGYTTRKNKLFSKRSLEYIIKNPVYCGYNRWNYRKGGLNVPNHEDEWIIEKGKHTALISKKLWDAAQEKHALNQTLRPSPINQSSKKHWLSGLLRCYHCGGSMTSHLVKGKYISFRCANYFKGSCNHPSSISGRKVEKYVLAQMAHDLKYTQQIQSKTLRQGDAHHTLERLQQQLKKTEKKYALANSAYLAEIDSIDEYLLHKSKIKKEEDAIIEEIERLKASLQLEGHHDSPSKFESICHLLDSTELTTTEKHLIARSHIKQIAFNSQAKKVIIEYYPFSQ